MLMAMLSLAPAAASAQPSSGPMTIERIQSGLLAGADVKVTTVDHHTSELVGGQLGWVVDESFFIGGGGYWLANNSRDRKMAYGGLVVQWLTHASDRVGFGAKALVGGGQATLADDFTILVPVRISAARIGTEPRTSTFRFEREFFIAEPEANVSLRLTDHVRLVGGVGYRLIGAEGRDDNRLRGATGTLGFQLF
jgi:hypothetical protein